MLSDLLWVILCVGVESPSHAIRADAEPHARSASSIVITLADKYTYDYPVQIIIYPSGKSATSKLTYKAMQLVSRVRYSETVSLFFYIKQYLAGNWITGR